MDKDTLFDLYEAYREFNVYTQVDHTLEISDEGWIRVWDEDGKEYNYLDAEDAIESLRNMKRELVRDSYMEEIEKT